MAVSRRVVFDEHVGLDTGAIASSI
ncbi:MAG: hypothetical protein LZF62_240194 [Nitrospira sp.]|nr:MAG: hypothetical protein LZF62_240194 [Nitrospira sp.]